MSLGLRRWRVAIELGLCVVLVGLLSLNALRRMDYFGADTAEHVRMTDASRTAYVAKNIAEGRGYTTNDLPAALIDFYDTRGKLHDAHWVNADRFPFAAYATAALYAITQSPTWEVGILVYNLLFFVGFLGLLYATTRSVWNDRYAALFAVTIALLHPYTYMFLYWKDGDMLFLTTACIALLVRYYAAPPGQLSRKLAIGFGTCLAFLFLARPNLGLPFLLFVGVSILRRIWDSRRERGVGGALKHHLSRELLIPAAVIVWCIPFVIHSMSEWGAPLFSANNLYQLPLGTRYGMGTDTWWKYTEPGHLPTLGRLIDQAGGQLLAKFTSSWLATVRHVFYAHALELVLACGLFAWLGSSSAEAERARPIRMVAWLIVFAVVTNLLVLPLYSYQDYSFRHYLAFGLPLLWLVGGRAISLLCEHLGPALATARDHVRAHVAWYLLAIVIGIIAWNLAGASVPDDQPRMFGRTGNLLGKHWLGALIVLVVILGRRWILRPPWFPRIALLMFTLVYSCYRPNAGMKRANFAFIALDGKVWDSMRQRQGLVSSFALQSEVAWNTDRKNIPAPEWPMHIYSFLYDHQLEVEDLYIESANLMVNAGPFSGTAPGFEGYARLQLYRTLPGYQVAFHSETVRGYPKFRIKPQLKASTVFALQDREAVKRMRQSPQRIVLGDPKNVIYTPHGWDQYHVIDDKPVVAGTLATRRRYDAIAEGPWEDSSVTFFLDQRKPTSVDFEIYVPAPGNFRFYWNLDLYRYDPASDRARHLIGTFDAPAAGWHVVKLEVPARLLRTGLNKLGFRAGAFVPSILCPKALTDEGCLGNWDAGGEVEEDMIEGVPARVVRASSATEIQVQRASLFAHALELHYPP
ncbi:MAG: hypothetical protein WKG01_27485 [Kofleriaceae bacterium]